MADVSLITSNVSGPSAVPSSQTSSVFPILESETIEIIDAIVRQVAADSGDWKPLLSAYENALQATGLDGSRDTQIYALLLRLAMERGRTWQIKWDNVKRAQLDANGVATPVARAVSEEDVFGTPGDRLKPTSHIASTAKHRRVPHQLPLTREALDGLQDIATPYKTIAATFLQTARPDHQQIVNKRRRPSPFSASSLGVVQDAADLTLVDGQFAQEDDSPSDVHQAEYLSALYFDATEIDRLATLGKVLDDWLARLTVLHRLRRHTDRARDAALKRRSLFRWRAHLLFVRKLEEAAGAAAATSLLRRCFNKWKNKTEENHRRAWEKELNSGFKRLSRKRNNQITQRCFVHWREASMRSRCRGFERRLLLSKTWLRWSAKSARVEEMREKAATMLEIIDEDLLCNALALWKRKTDFTLRESAFTELLDKRLMRHAIQSWQKRLAHIQTASEFCGFRLALGCMAKWRFRLQHVRNLKAQSRQLSKARDEDTLDRAFKMWHVKELGVLLIRAREVRVQRSAMTAWQDRHALISQYWQNEVARLRLQSDRHLLRSALQMWHGRTARKTSIMRVAASLASRLTLQRAMRHWRGQYDDQRRLRHHASIARAFFVQRSAVRNWHSALCLRRQRAWAVAKRRETLQASFKDWRLRAADTQRHRVLLNSVTAAIEQRIMSNALQRWTACVIDIRSHQLEISTTRNTHLLQATLTHWRDRTRQCVQDLSLGDSFRDVQEEDGLRRAFRRWRSSTRQKQSLHQRLDNYMRETELNTMSVCMEKWLDMTRENILAEEEARVVNYKQHQILKTAFRHWQRITIVLPAISFDNDRLRRTYFGIWQSRLPSQIQYNDACEHDRNRLLEATLLSWREAGKASIARRAANRFRAFATRQQHTSAILRDLDRTSSPRTSSITDRLHRVKIDSTDPALVSAHSQPARSSLPVKMSEPTTYTPRPLHPAGSSLSTTSRAATLTQQMSRLSVRQAQPVHAATSPIAPESVALPPSSTASPASNARSERDDDVFRDIRNRLAGGRRF